MVQLQIEEPGRVLDSFKYVAEIKPYLGTNKFSKDLIELAVVGENLSMCWKVLCNGVYIEDIQVKADNKIHHSEDYGTVLKAGRRRIKCY